MPITLSWDSFQEFYIVFIMKVDYFCLRSLSTFLNHVQKNCKTKKTKTYENFEFWVESIIENQRVRQFQPLWLHRMSWSIIIRSYVRMVEKRYSIFLPDHLFNKWFFFHKNATKCNKNCEIFHNTNLVSQKQTAFFVLYRCGSFLPNDWNFLTLVKLFEFSYF